MIISGSIPQSSSITGLRHALRSGEIVSLKVLSGSKDTWTVSVKGRSISVFSSSPLIIGKIIKARVSLLQGKVYFHTFQEESGITAFLRKTGMPDDTSSRVLIQAFQQSGLPLKQEILTCCRNKMKSDRHAHHLARLLAALTDKHLEVTEDTLERLYYLGWNGGGRHGRDEQKKKEEGKTESEGIDALKRTSDEEDPLQLYNHVQGGNSHWIMLPYRTSGNSEVISGALHICLDKRTSQVKDFIIHCDTDERHWRFTGVNTEGKETRIRVFTDILPEIQTSSEKMRKLNEKLHNLGLKVDDIIREDSDFGGNKGGELDSFEGIDTYA